MHVTQVPFVARDTGPFRVAVAHPFTRSNAHALPSTRKQYGLISFDNVAISLLNLFTVVTYEGWDNIMVLTQSVSGMATIAIFIILLVTGASDGLGRHFAKSGPRRRRASGLRSLRSRLHLHLSCLASCCTRPVE